MVSILVVINAKGGKLASLETAVAGRDAKLPPMVSDAALLAAVPDFISVGALLKATPHEESGRRILYIEASNEDRDHQDEVVLQKALADSSDYYLRHGNVDLDHFSILGPKAGIPDYMTYEIGKPAEVRATGKSTFVKAELYAGDSPMAKNANMVWESLTKQRPPSRWFPSVGGAVLAKSIKLDPASGDKVAVIERVRWNNLALSRTPVNKTVPEVSLAPVGTFAKSLGGFVIKALEASYATDAVGKTGGAALGVQSLDGAPSSYFDFRNKLAACMSAGLAGHDPGAGELVKFAAQKFSLSSDQAAEWVERFMRDLKNGLNSKRSVQ